MAAQHRGVDLVAGGREPFLVARVRVGLQEQLDDLGDRAAFRFVGLFGVQVQQEAPQAVAPAALGRDVVVHPRVGVAHGGEALGALPFVVVVKADPVGALAALADVRPA
jgi:hypothetical protein